MKARRLVSLAVAVVAAAALAACGSSSGGTAPGAAETYKIGVLTDLTGASASGFTTTENGVKAAVGAINAAGGINGHHVEYVVADTQSTTQGALSAAQSLVQKENVFAILEVSTVFYGAEPYLLRSGVPVVGGGFDSDVWTDPKYTNLFAATGVTDKNLVENTSGLYMKARGVTSCGGIGYSQDSSAKGAIGFVKSCESVGLKNGYLNTQIPFGSTDVGAIAIAIKNAGVDGVVFSTVPNTAFALLARLQELGVKLKSAVVPVGYGSELLQAPDAVKAAQGYEFMTLGQPVEMNTPATQRFQQAMRQYAGVTGIPGFAEYHAYIGMYAVAAGLKLLAGDPTRQEFIDKLRAVKDFDGAGLFGDAKIDFSNYHKYGFGGGNGGGCMWVVRLEGTSFVPVEGTPTCGQIVPGLTTG